MNENLFLEKLQEKARDQARFSSGSPLPEWAKPFASAIGLHYWQFLLVVSCVLAVLVSVWFFPMIYG